MNAIPASARAFAEEAIEKIEARRAIRNYPSGGMPEVLDIILSEAVSRVFEEAARPLFNSPPRRGMSGHYCLVCPRGFGPDLAPLLARSNAFGLSLVPTEPGHRMCFIHYLHAEDFIRAITSISPSL